MYNAETQLYEEPAQDHRVAIAIFLGNPLNPADMTVQARENEDDPVVPARTMQAVLEAMPAGLRRHVMLLDMVPMCSGTGTMQVADKRWDSVTKRSVGRIPTLGLTWVVACSHQVQRVFKRFCTETGVVSKST